MTVKTPIIERNRDAFLYCHDEYLNEKHPLSDKSLSSFRKRCYYYEAAYNADLLPGYVADLGKKIDKMTNVSPGIRRMDFMMIETNGLYP